MYHIIKSVISAGSYKLADIQQKIKRFHIRGDITEAEMDELLALASGNVCADIERPDTLAIIHILAEEIDGLKARVKVLEGSDTEDEPAAYPVWKPWNGIAKDYSYGAIVSHNDKLWESVFNGQNVWEPGIAGPDFWKPYAG